MVPHAADLLPHQNGSLAMIRRAGEGWVLLILAIALLLYMLALKSTPRGRLKHLLGPLGAFIALTMSKCT